MRLLVQCLDSKTGVDETFVLTSEVCSGEAIAEYFNRIQATQKRPLAEMYELIAWDSLEASGQHAFVLRGKDHFVTGVIDSNFYY